MPSVGKQWPSTEPAERADRVDMSALFPDCRATLLWGYYREHKSDSNVSLKELGERKPKTGSKPASPFFLCHYVAVEDLQV